MSDRGWSADTSTNDDALARRLREAEEELERCITRLLMHEPFFGHLLGNVVRGVSDEIPTAAVGGAATWSTCG